MKINSGTVITTFVLFTVEAMLHYNIGRWSDPDNTRFNIPTLKELIEMCGVVLIFSIINGIMVDYLF